MNDMIETMQGSNCRLQAHPGPRATLPDELKSIYMTYCCAKEQTCQGYVYSFVVIEVAQPKT